MSANSILDQIAGIKTLLQEQAEDCAQHAKYEQERREAADKQRAEAAALEALVRDELQKIMHTREEIVLSTARDRPKSLDSIDALMQLIKENHESRMSAMRELIQTSSDLRAQKRAKLAEEITRSNLKR